MQTHDNTVVNIHICKIVRYYSPFIKYIKRRQKFSSKNIVVACGRKSFSSFGIELILIHTTTKNFSFDLGIKTGFYQPVYS